MAYKNIKCAHIYSEIKEFICDTDADFANLPKACTGSTAVSIESGTVKIVNTKGKWVPFGEPSNEAIGIWVLDEEQGNLEESYNAWAGFNRASSFDIRFVSNNTEFDAFSITTKGSSSWGIYGLSFLNLSIGSGGEVYTHNPSGNYGISHGWVQEEFRTVTVLKADTDAIAWLNAHGTQVG